MRELSLHILDLVENSIRAQATTVVIRIVADPAADLLRIEIEDNGTGLKVTPEQALDPFYTTKGGKRTGLGLSLIRAAAEPAGGGLTLGRSDLGGVKVSVTMGLTHVDRNPLGDLAGSLGGLVCTNPEIDFQYHFCLAGRDFRLRSAALAEELGIDPQNGLVLARSVISKIGAELETAGVG
jgi:hypothetical protein